MSCNHEDGFYTERVKFGRGIGYMCRCEDCGARGPVKDNAIEALSVFLSSESSEGEKFS